MYQAKWKDRTFSITSNTIRTLTELGASYKVKKKQMAQVQQRLLKDMNFNLLQ